METTNKTEDEDDNDELENEEIMSDYEPPKKIQATSDHRDKLNSTTILNLNDDCLLHIFSYLSFYDKFKMSKLCRRFEDIFRMTLKKKLNISNLKEPCDEIKITSNDIQQILIKFGNSLEYICFKSNMRTTNGNAKGLLTYASQFCPHLKTLILKGSNEKVSTSAITYFPNLKSINELALIACNIDDEAVSYLSLLPELVSLNLSYNEKLTGKYLNRFEKLHTLLLSNCYQLEHSEIIKFCKSLKLLEKLEIDVLNDEILDVMIENLKNLKNLTLFIDDTICTHKIADIPNLKSLCVLCLFCIDLTDLTKRLAIKNQLETFSLPGIEIDILSLRLIPTIRSLKEITVALADTDNEFLENCSKCNSLEYLCMQFNEDLEHPDVIVNLIRKSKSLQILDLEVYGSTEELMIEKLILDIIDVIKYERKCTLFELCLTIPRLNKDRFKDIVPRNLSQIFKLSFEESD